MARQYNIKWTDKDERELKRIIKNFNAKVARLEKKEPLMKTVRPDRISYKDIRKNIGTRQDLNRKLNEIQRFSRKGAEEITKTKSGVITTKWQFREASIKQRAITAKRRKKRKNIESWQRQESESLFDKQKVSDVKPSGFESYIRSLEKEISTSYERERNEMYKRNYILSLQENLGIYSNEIISYINQIPVDVFVEASLTNPFLSVDFTYSESETEELGEQILSEWQRVT